jgi:hypothetical protein
MSGGGRGADFILVFVQDCISITPGSRSKPLFGERVQDRDLDDASLCKLRD